MKTKLYNKREYCEPSIYKHQHSNSACIQIEYFIVDTICQACIAYNDVLILGLCAHQAIQKGEENIISSYIIMSWFIITENHYLQMTTNFLYLSKQESFLCMQNAAYQIKIYLEVCTCKNDTKFATCVPFRITWDHPSFFMGFMLLIL